MAQQDNYIGIAMGLDVSNLKQGISEANKQIQLANSEFKRASSEMEDWTKSTDGLSAKITQLSSVLDAQKKKLAGIQAEYEKVAKEQGENSEQARKLKVQLNNQEAVVNATERELNNYQDTLKQAEEGSIDLENATLKAGKAVNKMGDEAKESGSKLDTLKSIGGGVVKGVGAIAGAVVGLASAFLATAESTREFRTNMSKLEASFTTAGLTAEQASETYNNFYAILGDEGQATEATAHLAQLVNTQEDLTKWTDIATGVYATFGDSLPIEGLTEAANETAKVGQLTGVLADALNWAGVNEDDFQARLDACNNEQERQALITETLNGLYSEASDKFKELNKDVIASQKASAEFSQAMADLGAIAEPIMTTLKELATDLLKTITPFVKTFGEGFNAILNGAEGGAEKMAQGINGLIETLLNKISDLLPSFIDIIRELIPMLIQSLLSAIPQLNATILQIITSATKLIGEMIPEIIEQVMDILPILINQLISAIPQLLEAGVQLLNAIVDATPIVVDSLLDALPSIINTIVNTLINSIDIVLDACITLLMAIVDAIPIVIQSLIDNLPQIINTIINALINAIPKLIQSAIQFLMSIVKAIPTIVNALITNLPQIITTIINTLLNNIPLIIETAIELFMAIVQAIPQICIELVKSLPQIITSIVNTLANGIKELFNIGARLMEGLWNGIKSWFGKIGEGINNWWNNLVDGWKNFWGIASPSKKMAKIGGFIGEGLGVGIKNSVPKIKKELDSVNSLISDNLGDVQAGIDIDSNINGARSSRGQIINAGLTINYNGKLSRKQIRKTENDYYRAVRLKLKSEGAI